MNLLYSEIEMVLQTNWVKFSTFNITSKSCLGLHIVYSFHRIVLNLVRPIFDI